ncbi:MAG: hypothetical protein F6K54_18235 [Okeania sp. SIO3B5]|uniref:DUF192 domain-containing protein n=1 Tax=Okeania sp. SIO3B5 TaxID=2607811 RepID=UPI001400BEA5|nr:DUF192 domain-containing protein [Okeania sp. SIO3B5]NEO54848.1 hypothetical protein [Okeania sp. SIO3B5]
MTNIQGTPGIDFLSGTPEDDIIPALTSKDIVQGFGGNDQIFGNQGTDVLQGNQGDDILYGGQDADTIFGGQGNDLMFGDFGPDWLIGDLGSDTMSGGEGDDLFAIGRRGGLSSTGGVNITDADVITDFGNGGDLLVLTGGLQFSELNIISSESNTIIQDRVTGEYLAVLSGVTSLGESSFSSIFGEVELGQMLPISAQASFSGQTINLEVAQTPLEQGIGLMFRTELPDDRGMLFDINPPRTVNFWMRNVFINLDMVFLRNGEVQAIFSNLPPCESEPCPTYGPNVPVDGVIELRGGRAAELGLRVGDRLDIQPVFLPV